jgi:transposase-like protein
LEYKLRVLREADRCSRPGELGALLRREGLYSSHLTLWRQQRRRRSLGAHKRGRRAVIPNPLAARVAELERENRRLSRRLRKAETILECQKKLSGLLGIPMNSLATDDSE